MVCLSLLAFGVVEATVYKCVNEQGEVEYTYKPCPEPTTTEPATAADSSTDETTTNPDVESYGRGLSAYNSKDYTTAAREWEHVSTPE